MPTILSILIYIASPIDAPAYRHTALYLEYPPSDFTATSNTTATHQTTATSLLEITGSHGFFTFQETPSYVPPPTHTTTPNSTTPTSAASSNRLATTIARRVPVAEISDSVTAGSIRMAVLSTPIRNGDADWNCQNWVGDALGRLVRKGFISGVQKEEGIDAMVDAVLEGADEG